MSTNSWEITECEGFVFISGIQCGGKKVTSHVIRLRYLLIYFVERYRISWMKGKNLKTLVGSAWRHANHGKTMWRKDLM